MNETTPPAVPGSKRERAASGGRMPRQDELPIQPQPTLFFRAVKALTWVVAHTLFSVQTTGARDLRRVIKKLPPGKPIIYVANHLSMADGPLLYALLPAKPRAHALAAGEMLTATRMRWWFARHVGGVFPVDRSASSGSAVDFAAVYEALQRPKPVALLGFPEARCGSVEGQLNNPPKSGLVHFGMNTGAVEIPIGITGTTRLWFRRRIKVKIGKPIEYTPQMTVAERVATQAAAIEALIEPYRQSFGPKYLQWLFPQTRKQRAHWRAEREGWNPDRLVARLYGEHPDLLATPPVVDTTAAAATTTGAVVQAATPAPGPARVTPGPATTVVRPATAVRPPAATERDGL